MLTDGVRHGTLEPTLHPQRTLGTADGAPEFCRPLKAGCFKPSFHSQQGSTWLLVFSFPGEKQVQERVFPDLGLGIKEHVASEGQLPLPYKQ